MIVSQRPQRFNRAARPIPSRAPRPRSSRTSSALGPPSPPGQPVSPRPSHRVPSAGRFHRLRAAHHSTPMHGSTANCTRMCIRRDAPKRAHNDVPRRQRAAPFYVAPPISQAIWALPPNPSARLIHTLREKAPSNRNEPAAGKRLESHPAIDSSVLSSRTSNLDPPSGRPFRSLGSSGPAIQAQLHDTALPPCIPESAYHRNAKHRPDDGRAGGRETLGPRYPDSIPWPGRACLPRAPRSRASRTFHRMHPTHTCRSPPKTAILREPDPQAGNRPAAGIEWNRIPGVDSSKASTRTP